MGDELVMIIADAPGVAARLLAVHVDDGTGHCRVCTNGAQAGRHVWPCPLAGLAARASEFTVGAPR
jgi:hypothetical protein